MSETLERVNEVFRTVFEDDTLVINEGTNAEQIEKWDSLQHINLLAVLEETFGITFDIDEIVAMENVGDIVSIIEAKKK